jgi:Cu(I)/Ag(I) efflux system membrane fusion protein
MSRSLAGLLKALVVLAVAIGVFIAGAMLATKAPPGPQHHSKASTPPRDEAATIWTCSMHPQIRMPAPGSCPICGMDLIPAKAAGAAGPAVVLGEDARTAGSIQTVIAERRRLDAEVRTVGRIEAAEPLVAYLTARADGRIERVYADYTGIDVRKGDHLVDLYAPILVVAQEELLTAARLLQAPAKGAEEPWETQRRLARQKLLLLGLTEEQIASIERDRTSRTALTVYAPIGGTVLQKNVKEGMYVKEGDALYTIADLSTVWLLAQIYEYELPLVSAGMEVAVEVEGAPGTVRRGRIAFVAPTVDDATRTVPVRVDVPNADRLLKPGMFAKATITARLAAAGRAAPVPLPGRFVCPMHPEVWSDEPGKCRICGMPLEPRAPASRPESGPVDPIVVPASAVLSTGTRKVVYLERDPGSFEAVEVTIGPRAQGFVAVLSGLSEGDVVVTRGNFLIDSQAQIEGKPSLLFPKGLAGAAPMPEHAGHR